MTGEYLARICTNLGFCAEINVFTTPKVVKMLIYDFLFFKPSYKFENVFLCFEFHQITNMNKEEMTVLAALVADQVVKKLKGVRNLSEAEYVDANEAARILGVSANYLRQVKDRYPHIKAGDQKQGRIMFRRDALLKEFK